MIEPEIYYGCYDCCDKSLSLAGYQGKTLLITYGAEIKVDALIIFDLPALRESFLIKC